VFVNLAAGTLKFNLHIKQIKIPLTFTYNCFSPAFTTPTRKGEKRKMYKLYTSTIKKKKTTEYT